jgi:DNA-binding NarL/FixJ family response regulator
MDKTRGGRMLAVVERATTADHDKVSRTFNDQQRIVMRMLCQGRSNKEIAIGLGITELAVRVQLRIVFRALKVENRTQAAVRWMMMNPQMELDLGIPRIAIGSR